MNRFASCSSLPQLDPKVRVELPSRLGSRRAHCPQGVNQRGKVDHEMRSTMSQLRKSMNFRRSRDGSFADSRSRLHQMEDKEIGGDVGAPKGMTIEENSYEAPKLRRTRTERNILAIHAPSPPNTNSLFPSLQGNSPIGQSSTTGKY